MLNYQRVDMGHSDIILNFIHHSARFVTHLHSGDLIATSCPKVGRKPAPSTQSAALTARELRELPGASRCRNRNKDTVQVTHLALAAISLHA